MGEKQIKRRSSSSLKEDDDEEKGDVRKGLKKVMFGEGGMIAKVMMTGCKACSGDTEEQNCY